MDLNLGSVISIIILSGWNTCFVLSVFTGNFYIWGNDDAGEDTKTNIQVNHISSYLRYIIVSLQLASAG
jgi:hypothetical protein